MCVLHYCFFDRVVHCQVTLVRQQSRCLMQPPCLHTGAMGVAAMRVVLQGAGVTEAGGTPQAEGNSTAGEVGAEAGVTATEAGVTATEAGVTATEAGATSTVGVSMAGVQGGATSAANKRKLILSPDTDQSLIGPNVSILVQDESSSLDTCLSS